MYQPQVNYANAKPVLWTNTCQLDKREQTHLSSSIHY